MSFEYLDYINPAVKMSNKDNDVSLFEKVISDNKGQRKGKEKDFFHKHFVTFGTMNRMWLE